MSSARDDSGGEKKRDDGIGGKAHDQGGGMAHGQGGGDKAGDHSGDKAHDKGGGGRAPDHGGSDKAPNHSGDEKAHDQSGREKTRDHGGDIDAAMAAFGGPPEAWIDLSTGINRCPYPRADLPDTAWTALPTAAAERRLIAAARQAYALPQHADCVPLAGAQAAIQAIPRLRPPGRVAIVAPTYNEHAAAFAAAGWTVREIAEPDAAGDADALVIVNPNNPDGRTWTPEALLRLVKPGRLTVVDESFADTAPMLSLCPSAGIEGLVILRSFGKFYGLAGVRLGFACGASRDVAALAAMAGPWAVNGPALSLGAQALGDPQWAAATRATLARDAARLDALATGAGWTLAGGTTLFRLYQTPSATAARAHLAAHRIWTRIFPYHPGWIRIGLPGPEAEWTRLRDALRVLHQQGSPPDR